MMKYIKHIGIPLVVIGTTVLAVSHFAGWTDINAVQLASLALIIAGIIVHVAALKQEDRY